MGRPLSARGQSLERQQGRSRIREEEDVVVTPGTACSMDQSSWSRVSAGPEPGRGVQGSRRGVQAIGQLGPTNLRSATASSCGFSMSQTNSPHSGNWRPSERSSILTCIRPVDGSGLQGAWAFRLSVPACMHRLLSKFRRPGCREDRMVIMESVSPAPFLLPLGCPP